MSSILNILPSPSSFLDDLFGHLNAVNLDVRSFELDHICYRVDSDARYHSLKNQITPLGEVLSQKKVNGRPIMVVRLNEPMIYQGRIIDILELPSPKEGSRYSEGWEHVEFVIDIDLYSFKVAFADLPWDTKGLNKSINPDIRLIFGEISVKFHENRLDYVIKHLD